jgi:hypothetical protein
LAVLFTLTLFVSAFLLFLVQPMLARMVLPLLGGTPAVWNTCMVFFQALLLAGYAYSHATPAWLGRRRQAILHVVVLLLPLAVLPIAVSTDWTPPGTGNPIPALLGLLVVTVGLPFFVVSTSGPLLQRWFAATGHKRARDPYFLYAASNLGSMIALLGYPFWFEPRFGLAVQSRLWMAGYGVFILLTFLCAVLVVRRVPVADTSDLPVERLPRLPWKRRLRWVVLAFVPSSLMLSVTTYLTTDIASIPLLWVLPLSLYLLTFIVVFARRQLLPLSFVLHWLPLVILVVVFVLLSEATEPVILLIAIHLFGLFWVGLACHGLLAADRPPVGYLTEFYLWLSVGGVLGGLFNALVAPVVFNSVAEYPLILVLACLLQPAADVTSEEQRDTPVPAPKEDVEPLDSGLFAPALEPERAALLAPADGELPLLNGSVVPLRGVEIAEFSPDPVLSRLTRPHRLARVLKGLTIRRIFDVTLPILLGLATAAIILICQALGVKPGPTSIGLMFAGPIVICYTCIERPLRFGLAIASVLLASSLYQGVLGKVVYRTRSFFGVHRVTLDPTGRYRVLAHGNTIHGKQSLDPDRRRKPLTYYYPTGPVGHFFAAMRNDPRLQRVGIIGLGSGTMVSYARTGQHWTYFEIDPAVARIARNPDLFTYWHDAEANGVHLDVVFGDARLTLGRTDERFGVIVLDAFSSDAIPVHLLTREAVRVYLEHLQQGGLLMINMSNRYLDLEPVVAELARDAGLESLFEDDRSMDKTDELNGKTMSQWIVMARREQDLPPLRTRGGVWAPPVERVNLPVWTDDYSNLFQVFRSLHPAE